MATKAPTKQVNKKTKETVVRIERKKKAEVLRPEMNIENELKEIQALSIHAIKEVLTSDNLNAKATVAPKMVAPLLDFWVQRQVDELIQKAKRNQPKSGYFPFLFHKNQ